MKIKKLTNYITYVEVEFDGFKPRLGRAINFNFQGHEISGLVVEVGRSTLIKVA